MVEKEEEEEIHEKEGGGGGKGRGLWGTWEELVLSFAVKRHGTNSWDFIAMEVQNRTDASSRIDVSAEDCRQRFLDLRKRFEMQKQEEEDEDEREMPWLEELRKIRLDELRRDVALHDDSILSLKLKLKRLNSRNTVPEISENGEKGPDPEEENRKQNDVVSSLKEAENNPVNLEGGKTIEEEEKARCVEEAEALPEPRKDESDPENRSYNESNSAGGNKDVETMLEPETKTVTKADSPIPAVEHPLESRSGEDRATVPASPADSCNGSTETIAKEPAVIHDSEFADDIPTVTGDGIQESCAESKDGGDSSAGKQSSDGLSSVGRTKKRKSEEVKATGTSSSGDNERLSEAGEVHPAAKKKKRSGEVGDFGGMSLRLSQLISAVRYHKYGHVLEGPFDNQDSNSYYRSVIRQHMDLSTVERKMEEGDYSTSQEVFRDLLLLFNNALLFFHKNTKEFKAAVSFRNLVTKEIPSNSDSKQQIRKPKVSQGELQEENPPPLPPNHDLDRAVIVSDVNVLSKPNNVASSNCPIIVCRKRSSLSSSQSAKAAPTDTQPQLATDQQNDERPSSQSGSEETTTQAKEMIKEKEKQKPSNSSAADQAPAKRPLIGKGSRTNKTRMSILAAKNRKSNDDVPTPAAAPNPSSSSVAAVNVVTEKGGGPPSKKRSAAAANFLNRMKNSSNGNGSAHASQQQQQSGSLLESLKRSNAQGNRTEQKKGGGGGGVVKKEQGTTKSGSVGGKQQQQMGVPASKRGVGRPPKKETLTGRQRSGKEAEPERGQSRMARKRARR